MTRLQWPHDELGMNKAPGQHDPARSFQPFSPSESFLAAASLPGEQQESCADVPYQSSAVFDRVTERPLRDHAWVISIMMRCLSGARDTLPHTAWGHLMGQHHVNPQPASLCLLLIPPLCWLCQALELVYMALFSSWLSAAVAEVSLGTWVHPPDPCLPQQAQSISLLPALHTSLALGFGAWALW